MLSITLVLLLATSALAYPTITAQAYPANQIDFPADNGNMVSASVLDRAMINYIDEADMSFYGLNMKNLVTSLGNAGDSSSQAIAASQAVALMSYLATGNLGNSCSAASLINAVVEGNQGAISGALNNYFQDLNNGIQNIVNVNQNLGAAKYATGPAGNCALDGREFNFEAAWDIILSNANSNNVGILEEQYCVAKRMYQAFSGSSNGLAAIITAAALAPVTQVHLQNIVPISNFVRAIGTSNVANAGASAQYAISQGLNLY